MKKFTKGLKKAFTITELVIVIAVIAILAAVLIPTFSNVISSAKQSAAMQECHSAYLDYSAKAQENDIDVTGMVFTSDGYAFVSFGGGLHLLGELDDLAYLNVSSATVENEKTLDADYRDKITTTAVSSVKDNTLYITVTDKDGKEHKDNGDPAVVKYGETAEPTKDNDPPKHLGELIYFYTFALNGTQYLGYFTMENAGKDITKASFRSNDKTLYSRMFGYVSEDEGTKKIGLSVYDTDPSPSQS